MTTSTEAQQKTILVGKERICRQIAYVLDLHDYELAEKLTKRDLGQSRDYQIYVCAFKRKSCGLVGKKVLREAANKIQYLDDICRKIDEAYYANRKRHENHPNDVEVLPTPKVSTKAVAVEKQPKIVAKINPEPVKNDAPSEPKQPLMTRIRRGMKHPFRAAWHVVLRIKETIRRHRSAAKRRRKAAKRLAKERRTARKCQRAAIKWQRLAAVKLQRKTDQQRRIAIKRQRAAVKWQRLTAKGVAKQQRNAQKSQAQLKSKPDYQQIAGGNSRFLRRYFQSLKPSELLLYVLQAKPNNNIRCKLLETDLRVGLKGVILGCCSAMVPFGSLLNDGELDEIYHSTYARIVKLSSLNHSYCLCDLNRWCHGYCSQENQSPAEQWQTAQIPQDIFLSFDNSCNLCCRACRTQPYVLDDATRKQLDIITAKLLRSGWLDQVKNLGLAGSGETFYSSYYRQIWAANLQRQKISIKSNGTLFNETNWRLLAGKYTTIDADISVDAATAETYQKLRGADFANLMKNLTMLSDLRRKKQIHWFGLSFVVQRDNFREMPAFVELGKSLGVDRIEFQRINNLGSFTAQEFSECCLIIDNSYLDYELWCVLQDPIFHDPIVELSGLQRYIDASEHLYRRRYEREQRHSV